MSNPATNFTIKKNEAVLSELDFKNDSDFSGAKKGFIASVESGIINGASNLPIVNLNEYQFIEGEAPNTVNPSLWRQAQLNNIHGLFKVVDGIYQVRSLDVAIITFLETDTGYIVVDPLTNIEAARASFELVKAHIGDKPVHAVISTHSHADHYGGIEGIVPASDILSGKVKYITPVDFYKESVSENVLLGNVMVRRAGYQFGFSLPKDTTGQIDAGLGKALIGLSGTSSILEPNLEIKATGESVTVDGLEIIFQLAPETEAPAEFYFYLPKYKAFCPAENANRTQHNILTPRGAKVRDAKSWANYLDESIDLFGDQTEVVFLTHGWPIWGHEQSIEFLEKQRDLYKFIHDQTVRLANKGLNQDEIAEIIELPKELGQEWYNRNYYGTIQHNSKAVYQYYLGWWDGNPANYNKLTEVEAAKRYVEYFGGEDVAVSKARDSYDKGEYRWVAEVLKHVVFANPQNREARNLQADAFEQIGYQSESGIWRNIYLTGAQELRLQGNVSEQVHVANPYQAGKFLSKLTAESLFDFLAISVDGKKAEGKEISIRFIFPDSNKNILVSLKNGVLHQSQKRSGIDAQLTLTISREKFVKLLADPAKSQEILQSQDISIEGNIFRLKELAEVFDHFKPNWNIVTP